MRPLSIFIFSIVLGCGGADDKLECGEGTHEEDGACVSDDETDADADADADADTDADDADADDADADDGTTGDDGGVDTAEEPEDPPLPYELEFTPPQVNFGPVSVGLSQSEIINEAPATFPPASHCFCGRPDSVGVLVGCDKCHKW